MMKQMHENFSQLMLANRNKGTFTSQPKVHSNGQASPSPSFDPNKVRGLNVVITFRSRKEVDNRVGKTVNVQPSPSSASDKFLDDDVKATSVDDDANEEEPTVSS